MVTKEQFYDGIVRYIDTDVIPHLPQQGKWGLGALVVLANKKTSDIITALAENKTIQMLGVTTEDGMIDIALLRDALKTSAEKYGKMQISLPIIGTLTFSAEDIDVIASRIEGCSL